MARDRTRIVGFTADDETLVIDWGDAIQAGHWFAVASSLIFMVGIVLFAIPELQS